MTELVAPSCENGGFVHRILDLWRSGKVLRSTTGQVAPLEQKLPFSAKPMSRVADFVVKFHPLLVFNCKETLCLSWKLHDPKEHKFSILDFHDDNMPFIITEQMCEGILPRSNTFRNYC